MEEGARTRGGCRKGGRERVREGEIVAATIGFSQLSMFTLFLLITYGYPTTLHIVPIISHIQTNFPCGMYTNKLYCP